MSKTAPKSKRNIDAYVKALQAENEKLRQALMFIVGGLKRGTIKSQPIMTCIPNAKEWPIQTLEEVIEEALKSKNENRVPPS